MKPPLWGLPVCTVSDKTLADIEKEGLAYMNEPCKLSLVRFEARKRLTLAVLGADVLTLP